MKRFSKTVVCVLLQVLFFFYAFPVRAQAADIAPRYVRTVDEDAGTGTGVYTCTGTGVYASGETKNTITMMFAGDIMCLSAQQHVGVAGDCWDFRYSFDKVRKIFAGADLALANLETLVSNSNVYTGSQKNAENGLPQCNAPGAILAAARYAGIDALMTANNHACDWGRVGIEETLDMLDLFRFMHTGTNWPGDARYVIADVCGIRVALISTTHIINQRGLIAPEELEQMVNTFDINRLREDIASAKEAGAEFVVTYVHWGSENVEDIRDYQLSDAGAIAEAGADLIVGSHPHCLQTRADITTTDGRIVPVYYSLGNFLSSMAKNINNDTVILKVTAKRDATGRVVITDTELIPCWVTYSTFIITPIDDAGAAASSTLRESRNRIRGIFPLMK